MDVSAGEAGVGVDAAAAAGVTARSCCGWAAELTVERLVDGNTVAIGRFFAAISINKPVSTMTLWLAFEGSTFDGLAPRLERKLVFVVARVARSKVHVGVLHRRQLRIAVRVVAALRRICKTQTISEARM